MGQTREGDTHRDIHKDGHDKDGDATAFEELFRAYYSPLVTLAIRYLHERSRAEEVVQDVFLKIWERRNTLHVNGPLTVYLYSAVRNESLKRAKRQAREHEWTERAATDAFHEAPPANDADELTSVVTKAMLALPERCREIFRLYREHDLNSTEIAAILDISPATVRVQLARAMYKLRDAVRDFAPGAD